jgi:hypothetical protein
MSYTKPERFGIKEVADVAFYALDAKGQPTGEPVIVFDTLKVSNIEYTAEQAEARGGKGNAPLIIWDYGREITVTLEDALLSMETLGLMFENSKTAGSDGTIEISANTYPGTYYVEGKTFARNENDGKDHLLTFKIYKAKIQSEVTLTMEADGDPTVFGMNLRVLRADGGKMMSLEREATEFSGEIEWDDKTPADPEGT